jgi:hypothetical protein
MSTPRIQQLAETISTSVAKIQEVLKAKGIESPSFNEDAPTNFPLEIFEAQSAVLDATSELNDLLMEPMSMIHSLGAVSISDNSTSKQHISTTERRLC